MRRLFPCSQLFAVWLVYVTQSNGQSLITADDEQGGIYKVPIYQAPMLNDVVRNDAFFKALSKVVTPSSIVVDVGAGRAY